MDRRGVAKTSKDEFENNWNYAQCSVMTVDEPLRRLASRNHLYLPNQRNTREGQREPRPDRGNSGFPILKTKFRK